MALVPSFRRQQSAHQPLIEGGWQLDGDVSWQLDGDVSWPLDGDVSWPCDVFGVGV